MNHIEIKFRKTHSNAILPEAKHKNDAGFDLYAVEDILLEPGETKAIDTGLQLAGMTPYSLNDIETPCNGYCIKTDQKVDSSVFLKVEGRSGMALKGIFPIGGIIDSSYRANIKVILHNGNPSILGMDSSGKLVTNKAYEIKAGDRIAQLLVYKILGNTENDCIDFQEVNEVDTDSARMYGGLGSTGR